MNLMKDPRPLRRSLAASLLLALAACSNAAQAATYTMYRDAGCGCCLNWAGHVEHGLEAEVASVDTDDMAALKTARGVPQDLWSCHTMEVDGYIIEGHVPADAVAKLLRERPEGVAGLAVPGMPLGSPGMEVGEQVQPYDVIAFGPGGRSVFASYP
ncbi:DUF411 domain-containing protein [Qipengyuania zhejiangensis]|uniref:DUF411 domain-containing protein n=1 Tax=Qipengyuania zhejiangensis TaxID=3077782 RepID=UPI002D784470|nr:DUF411 domain-containing protein [Qipengyuania sp. Z2]